MQHCDGVTNLILWGFHEVRKSVWVLGLRLVRITVRVIARQNIFHNESFCNLSLLSYHSYSSNTIHLSQTRSRNTKDNHVLREYRAHIAEVANQALIRANLATHHHVQNYQNTVEVVDTQAKLLKMLHEPSPALSSLN